MFNKLCKKTFVVELAIYSPMLTSTDFPEIPCMRLTCFRRFNLQPSAAILDSKQHYRVTGDGESYLIKTCSYIQILLSHWSS